MFTVSACNLYVYNHSDILIHTYIVLLAPLTLVAVEKAIYEATSVKKSYSECKTVFFAIFIESK